MIKFIINKNIDRKSFLKYIKNFPSVVCLFFGRHFYNICMIRFFHNNEINTKIIIITYINNIDKYLCNNWNKSLNNTINIKGIYFMLILYR